MRCHSLLLPDYLDADGLAKYAQNTLGLPAKVMRSDGQVRQIRKQRAEAEAAMQQQQQMEEAKALWAAAPMVKQLNNGKTKHKKDAEKVIRI